jgi:Fe-Mn family superoxide dismutase
MTFSLPPLPFERNALAPHISEETLHYHYDKHHQTYVTNLNKLVLDTPFFDLTLEEVIRKCSGGIFNNAAQVWNHSFYWNCLSPNSHKPSDDLTNAIGKKFGSFDEFKEQFTQTALATFGSGWAWLTQDKSGELHLRSTSNAGTPMTQDETAVLTCDVWEHAYYIDYRNARPDYLKAFWEIVNWTFVSQLFKA